jgi:iron-sulfur cluster assembly protein/iron-sulfur cluster insertion protein
VGLIDHPHAALSYFADHFVPDLVEKVFEVGHGQQKTQRWTGWQDRRLDFGVKSAAREFDRKNRFRFVAGMITLTTQAARQVQSMRASMAGEGKRLRVLVESGGCSGFQYGMSFDEAKEGDAHFESEGVAILVDPASLAYLNGSTIDFDDGLHGKGFDIRNPNAQSTCGCGKSFS